MTTINIHAAKTQLSQLLERVNSGEEVVIAKAGKPVARLIPYVTAKGLPRKPGALKGQIEIADDFDELPEGIAAAFRGESP
ncbi:MAG: type II toxin-antitoxin system Phd/YefM family antitoxin [Candidatus Sumerlaeaceae bacterium]